MASWVEIEESKSGYVSSSATSKYCTRSASRRGPSIERRKSARDLGSFLSWKKLVYKTVSTTPKRFDVCRRAYRLRRLSRSSVSLRGTGPLTSSAIRSTNLESSVSRQ